METYPSICYWYQIIGQLRTFIREVTDFVFKLTTEVTWLAGLGDWMYIPKLRTKFHVRSLVIFLSLARISRVKDCVEQGPFSGVANRLVGFHIPCVLGDWWLSTLFRVFCHWNLSLASWIVSTYMICLFKVLFDIMRHHAPNLMSGLVSWFILTVFCMHFSYPSCLSQNLLISTSYMKRWALRRRPRSFDFFFHATAALPPKTVRFNL